MQKVQEPTRIYKSIRNGWTAETMRTIHDSTYQIYTGKANGGKLSSSAQKGNITEGGGFSFMMFGDERIHLCDERASCTENTIRALHNKALLIFDELKKDEAAGEKPYTVEVGQIVFTDFIQSGCRDERVVYEVLPGKRYKTVLLDASDIKIDDHVRNYKDVFGIGVYYNEGETVGKDEINNLLISAHENITKRNASIEAQSVLDKAEREHKIEIGRKLVTIPPDAVAILVAHHKVNDCELQSDYFGCHTDRTVYLAFSTHHKDSFAEMRTAAALFEETAYLATADKDAENREKYSGGSGYYLGLHSYSGWEVRKSRLTGWRDEPITEQTRQQLYIAAADGRYFCNSPLPTSPLPQSYIETKNDMQLIFYSPKAIVMAGDTKKVKEQLKSLGGRFNNRLKHPETGTLLIGWVFPMGKLDILTQTFNIV